MSQRELHEIFQLVYQKSGITLGYDKQILIETRLATRLRDLGISSYKDYLRLVADDATGGELSALLDAISTNHTYFFREPRHFDFLKERVLPDLAHRGRRPLRLWSAACSSGEEPYSIAITLLEAGWNDFSLLGSDLSTKVLKTGRRGIYKLERVKDIPSELLRKYFERGMGAQAGLARLSRDMRNRVRFEALNLIEIESLGHEFDIIFCRNVMIYFDTVAQQRVVTMMENHLAPGGYLFIAHSENLNDIRHRLQRVAPAVFRRDAA